MLQRKTLCPALLLATVALGGGCGELLSTDQADVPPAVGLTQTGARTVDVTIAGPTALRGLQLQVRYDERSLRLTKAEAGKDSARLDRVFWSNVTKANGTLTAGLSDTRKVLLPARGALLRLTFEPVGAGGSGVVRVENLVASLEKGTAVSLSGTSLSVRVQ